METIDGTGSVSRSHCNGNCSIASAFVVCPEGKAPITGGYFVSSLASRPSDEERIGQASVYHNAPLRAEEVGEGWATTVLVENKDSIGLYFLIVTVVCANK